MSNSVQPPFRASSMVTICRHWYVRTEKTSGKGVMTDVDFHAFGGAGASPVKQFTRPERVGVVRQRGRGWRNRSNAGDSVRPYLMPPYAVPENSGSRKSRRRTGRRYGSVRCWSWCREKSVLRRYCPGTIGSPVRSTSTSRAKAMMYSRNTYACVLLARQKKSGYDRFSGRAAAPRGKNKTSRQSGCVFRSIRSRIGIEVRSAIRIHSINRELNFFYRFFNAFFRCFPLPGGFFLSDSP